MSAQRTPEPRELVAKLQAEYDAAVAASRLNRTPETMQAVRSSSSALSTAIVVAGMLPEVRGYSTRAGRRQYAERRAAIAKTTGGAKR